jgi:hypothetical protein
VFRIGRLDFAIQVEDPLEAENAALRHQLIVLRRKLHGRVKLANSDRWFFIQLYRWFPSILKVLTVIRPETLVRWHRAGFRSYWRWKSRSLGGRPQIETDLRVNRRWNGTPYRHPKGECRSPRKRGPYSMPKHNHRKSDDLSITSSAHSCSTKHLGFVIKRPAGFSSSSRHHMVSIVIGSHF